MADHVSAHGSLQTAVHQSANLVSNYQHYVRYIGTSEDTFMFREKLHEARQHVGDLLKDISVEIEHEIHDHIKAKNNVVDAKIIKEFGAVVREYRETERLEAEEEASHVPVAPQQANLLTSRDKNDEAGRNADQDADLRKPLDELKRMEVLHLENENALKEILRDGEENEEEVRRVQGEINYLKALINDLKSLKEQVDAADIQSTLQVSTSQPQACDKESNSDISGLLSSSPRIVLFVGTIVSLSYFRVLSWIAVNNARSVKAYVRG